MSKVEKLSGVGTEKELVENEILKVTERYNGIKSELKDNFHSIISELGETDFEIEVEGEDNPKSKVDIKELVAQKKNKKAITIQLDNFESVEEELFILSKQMKYLKRILNVLNRLDEFKQLDIVYNFHFTKYNLLYIFFTATIKDPKAQVVYRSVFTQDVLELKTDFDFDAGGFNNDTYILPSGNMYSYKEFLHLEKERTDELKKYLTSGEADNYFQTNDYKDDLKKVLAEEKVIETITEQEYKDIYTDLYLDFLLFTELYIK